MASYSIVERIDLDVGVWGGAFCRIEEGIPPQHFMLFSVLYPDGKTVS
jgi:hypothetical protein